MHMQPHFLPTCTQIPGTLLLVVLELFLKLDAKSAEAAVHSLDPPDDTGMDCIYEAFRTGMSELCSMPTPPGSCSENPLPGLAAPPPPPPALQQDHQPQQQTQTLGQLHSSGATTTRIMRHAGGRVGHLAGVFSLDVQAQTAGSVPANGAAHTTSAALAAAAVGSCSADTQSKSNGSGSKGKEDSPPGLFEQQSQGAQQHNIEIWERFSQASGLCLPGILKAACPCVCSHRVAQPLAYPTSALYISYSTYRGVAACTLLCVLDGAVS
eukprot:1155099-Pelagomonas_calceolata.AAC.7